MEHGELLEISVVVDSEAAEAVSELFNRYNGGGYEEENEAGEAAGGGAVIEATGFDDFDQPIDGQFRIVVKTYIKPGRRGQEIRRQIEEGLWHLGRIYPIPEPDIRVVREEDWAHAWKKFYKPMRVGKRVVLKPTWEEFTAAADDLIIELDPGMAFGTGLHPSTRLCLAALEALVRPGDAVLDLGTGSGILAIAAAKLGAQCVVATDIDPVAVTVAQANLAANGLLPELANPSLANIPAFTPVVEVRQESVPAGMAGRFQVIVANILAEVLVGLFDSKYGNVPLAEPLAPGGHMVLSGIIEEKGEMVAAAAARHGLELVDRRQENDWLALVVRRPGEGARDAEMRKSGESSQ
ncbi:MAG TPA: 50S ribosomal protein L11 methyltransferase [Caldilineaceae bacterium]|nr:50S ribosomal protein L11 methyltransferase [Caldilineaceae bacterium]